MRSKEKWDHPSCSVSSTCFMTPFALLLLLSGSLLLLMPPSSVLRRFSDQFGSIFSRLWLWLGCTGWQFIYSDAHLFIRHCSQDISLTETPRQTPKGSSCLSPSNPTTSTIRLDLKSDHITLLFRESELLCIHSVKCKLPSLADKALRTAPSLHWCFFSLLSPLCTSHSGNTKVPVALAAMCPVISHLCLLVHPESTTILCCTNSSSWPNSWTLLRGTLAQWDVEYLAPWNKGSHGQKCMESTELAEVKWAFYYFADLLRALTLLCSEC